MRKPPPVVKKDSQLSKSNPVRQRLNPVRRRLDSIKRWSDQYRKSTTKLTSPRDEARFIDQGANMTEVNPATRLGSVTTRSTTLTNERSRSGSRAQLTALYNEAATLCVTDSLPSTSKVNITKNSQHLNNSTHRLRKEE
ncbi:hypothetical protein FHG87_014645 [Trinorchestia longiramus]|nr:hypothetical protein FHG87_014645 [Trinorchestia longiramus]